MKSYLDDMVELLMEKGPRWLNMSKGLPYDAATDSFFIDGNWVSAATIEAREWAKNLTPPDATYDPVLPQTYVDKQVRTFTTGATRDQDATKYDPEGFLCPLVIERFNEYMHANRKQRDGSVRDSDNWQKGIPTAVYMKSLWRHFHDIWLHHRGYAHKAKEPLEVALCGVMFNTMGMLHELLKSTGVQQSP